MAEEMGYKDSVARMEGAHSPDGSGEARKFMGETRKEYAGPGHAGRSDATHPIGPQSGFSPLGEEKAAHGSGEYTGDSSAYRREYGKW